MKKGEYKWQYSTFTAQYNLNQFNISLQMKYYFWHYVSTLLSVFAASLHSLWCWIDSMFDSHVTFSDIEVGIFFTPWPATWQAVHQEDEKAVFLWVKDTEMQ